MIVGVDFDNTIVNYDDIFQRLAVEWGLVGKNSIKNKKDIRDAIRQLPEGDKEWQKLQAIVYGHRMVEAKLNNDVSKFFQLCKRYDVKIYIVSHKSEFPNLEGLNVNLRAAALLWMKKNNFFNEKGLNLARENVFFEPTRAAKIKKIKSLKCTHFIDDLEETFLEPSFPASVEKILYAPQRQAGLHDDLFISDNWEEIIFYLQSHLLNGKRIKKTFSVLLNQKISSVENIDSGKNSKAYKLFCENGQKFATKIYFRHSLDNRDRLAVEFSSLQFLWANGIRCIPRPILADRRFNCGIYEYIEGKKFSPTEISSKEIDCAVDFLAQLKELANTKDSGSFADASEACFSIGAIVANLESRLNKLLNLKKIGPSYDLLNKFLMDKFLPLYDKILQWCRESAAREGLSFTAEIETEAKTLSPSDFGFHNAIKKEGGQIVFLDFEYFGWDDPAKTISDFLLHPAMKLREDLKQQFAKKMLKTFKDRSQLGKRLKIVYPLFGLKWCLILLNEFLTEHMLRRKFANKEEINQDNVLLKQLAKAEVVLQKISNEYKSFPYSVQNIIEK